MTPNIMLFHLQNFCRYQGQNLPWFSIWFWDDLKMSKLLFSTLIMSKTNHGRSEYKQYKYIPVYKVLLSFSSWSDLIHKCSDLFPTKCKSYIWKESLYQSEHYWYNNRHKRQAESHKFTERVKSVLLCFAYWMKAGADRVIWLIRSRHSQLLSLGGCLWSIWTD